METAGRGLKDELQREAMKDSGLGTPATRAGIIEILLSRRYIERKGKSLVPTKKGLEVYHIVKDKRIADVEMTGMWEAALLKIESGEMAPVSFKNSIETYTKQITSELLNIKIERTAYPQCSCPRCKGNMVLYPKIAKCSNPNCSLVVFRIVNKVVLSDEQLLTMIAGGRTPYLKFMSKTGKPYQAALSLDEDYVIEFHFKGKK